MTITEFARELEANIDAATPGSILPESRFREFPWWDSLAALTVLAVFDASFGRQITGEQLARCETIAQVFELSRQS